MEYPREIRWPSVLVALSCSLTLLVCTPLWAGTTSSDQTPTNTIVNASNYLYVEPDSTEIHIEYDYDQEDTNQDSSVTVTNYSGDYGSSTPIKSDDQFNQFSSGTAFVDYYLAPLGPTYRFLDRNRRHQWPQTTLKYTFIDLDSSLSYKSKMLGGNFKAEARADVLDESSLSLNWTTSF